MIVENLSVIRYNSLIVQTIMLTLYTKPQFISRVFTDVSGRQFRLTFLVTLVNGEVRGRLVSADPISPVVARLSGEVSTGSIPCLPIFCDGATPQTVYAPAFAPLASPYFSLEFLINSQPTRAPSRF